MMDLINSLTLFGKVSLGILIFGLIALAIALYAAYVTTPKKGKESQ